MLKRRREYIPHNKIMDVLSPDVVREAIAKAMKKYNLPEINTFIVCREINKILNQVKGIPTKEYALNVIDKVVKETRGIPNPPKRMD